MLFLNWSLMAMSAVVMGANVEQATPAQDRLLVSRSLQDSR